MQKEADLIKTLFEQFTAESSNKKSLIKQIISEKIDSMKNNSTEWFSGNPPAGFFKIIESLEKLLQSDYFDTVDDSIFIEEERREIFLPSLFRDIASNKKDLLTGIKFKIHGKNSSNLKIISQENKVSNAVCNVLFALRPFFIPETMLSININKDNANVFIQIKADNLSKNYPGLNSLKKIFFKYKNEGVEHLGVGLGPAVVSFRESGAHIKFEEGGGKEDFSMMITYPSIEFMDSLREIRESAILDEGSKSNKGNVILIMNDHVMEMILNEMLDRYGYKMENFQLIDIESISDFSLYKALIVDYDYIKSGFINLSIFINCTRKFRRVIIIFGSNDPQDFSEFLEQGFHCLKKPVEIDEIVSRIEL